MNHINVRVLSRSPEKSHVLASELNAAAKDLGLTASVSVINDLAAELEGCHVVIHCTPIGMTGGSAPDAMPIAEGILKRWAGDAVGEARCVFETVYTPASTPLVECALKHNLRVISGQDMFWRQAEMQFESWTGVHPPIGLFRQRLGRSTNREETHPT
jgi:shikimate 5-dehydrogenase